MMGPCRFRATTLLVSLVTLIAMPAIAYSIQPTGTNVIAGTITPIVVHSIRGLSEPSGVPITPRVMPLNDLNISSKAPTSATGSGLVANTGTNADPQAPAPIASFEGLHTTTDCVIPPDSDGTVGSTYFVAFVNNVNNCSTQTPAGNVGFYCKAASAGPCTSQGILAAAFYYPKLFTGLSTNCNSTTTQSDPQVVYDSGKDRYLFVDITVASPFQLCVAATLSNDPVNGPYCAASYPIPNNTLPDYDKAGVWIDGFYVSYNPTGNSRTVTFNKDDLEACRTIHTQDFDMGSDTKEGDNQCVPQPNHIFRPDPATYNIVTGVPAQGEPEFIVSSFCLSSHIYVFTLHVDWSNLSNSKLTRALVATRTQSTAPSTVTTPGNSLDTLHLHTMVPVPYFRDSNGNEYVWTTITSRGSSTSTSAISWYQLKVANNAPSSTTVANQNLWNPDSTSRLQAAAAFDRSGDVLMEYTQVSASQDPAVAYAGRLTSDPANTLGQTENILFRGPSMGSGSCNGTCTRWGDYAANFIDLNGCTFWFTDEYYKLSDPWQWDTRIGSTSYAPANCTPLTYSRTVSTSSLSFTSNGIGAPTAPLSVIVTNNGTGPLVVQPPTINGTNNGDFSVSSNNCLTVLVINSTSCTIQVNCTPTALGNRTATLNIMTNLHAADSTSISLSCSILTAPMISVSMSTIDSGQSSTLSATSSFSGGTSPYTCQWLQKAPSATSYSNLSISFSCNVGDTPTTSTGTLASAGTWSFQLQVTDSSGKPATSSSNPVSVIVNPALAAGAITPTGPSIDPGQSITLTANPSGGTTPYNYQWFSGTSPTCSSDTTLLGTASTQTVSPTSSTYYCYKVTDSSFSSSSQFSPTDLITVNSNSISVQGGSTPPRQM